jgi:2',3'-cyclic-nucleotide 2'-phosphodiesterase (5'-nucleotidase family)
VDALNKKPKNIPKGYVYLNADLDGSKNEVAETNMGDLIADIVRDASQADFALVSAADILPVKITKGVHPIGEIVQTLHYGNDAGDTITILNIKGSQLIGASERSLSREPSPFGGFLQVSGLEIRFDASRPEGERVKIFGTGGVEIAPSKVYRIATTKSVAEGAFGYFKMWGKEDAVKSPDDGATIAKAVTDYIAKHNDICPVVEGRIKGL